MALFEFTEDYADRDVRFRAGDVIRLDDLKVQRVRDRMARYGEELDKVDWREDCRVPLHLLKEYGG